MKTRIYGERKNVVAKEQWFKTDYAVPIFFPSAIMRWISAGESVMNHSGQEPFRILTVRTLSMNDVCSNSKKKESKL